MQDKISFFKSYYENQHKRREKIYEQFFYFISLLTVQIGFFGFYLLNFPTYKSEDSNLFYFFIFCLLVVVGLIIKIFFIIHLWTKDKTYAEFGKPTDIKKYIDELEEFNNGSNESSQWNKYILNEYITISNHNITINEARHALNMQLRRYLMYILNSLIFSFIPYFFLMGNELNSQKVIILNNSIEKECQKNNDILIENLSTLIHKEDIKKSKKNYSIQRKKIVRHSLTINKSHYNYGRDKNKEQSTIFNDRKFIFYKLN